MLDLISLVLAGIALGFVTGTIPGVHPNVLAGLAFYIPLDPINASILLVSAAVTHTFVDYIPSIFLGAPSDDTSLSVLPGHKMLLEGKGIEAIALTVLGGIGSVIFIVLMLPLVTRTFPFMYEWIRPHIHILLILLSLWMISRSKWSLLIFALSGLVGYIVLDMHFLGARGFLPMFTGMFGLPMLIISYGTLIPKQNMEWNITKKEFFAGGVMGSVAGMFLGMLPGVGSAQASAAVKEITKNDDRMFLLSSGAINTSDAILSVLALWLIGNPRSGVAVAIGNMMELQMADVILLSLSVVVASSFAAILTMKHAKLFSRFVSRVNYRKLSMFIILFLVSIVIISSGWKGLLLLVVSTSIGLICNLKNVNRSTMMASLIVPTIIFFSQI